jgi:hypothetical protein
MLAERIIPCVTQNECRNKDHENECEEFCDDVLCFFSLDDI